MVASMIMSQQANLSFCYMLIEKIQIPVIFVYYFFQYNTKVITLVGFCNFTPFFCFVWTNEVSSTVVLGKFLRVVNNLVNSLPLLAMNNHVKF